MAYRQAMLHGGQGEIPGPYLALAKDSAQRSECDNHRAFNQANTSQRKLEATGIGGPNRWGDNGDWANLNIISPSAQGMSTPHQQECLDYQMNDCNFMKMIHMGLFLSRKYKEAKQGLAKSSQAFDALNNAAEPEMVNRWQAQEREAQSLQIDGPSALDIYDVWMQKGGCWMFRKIVAGVLMNYACSMI
ncbi:hypothetical protein DFJ58DRAFT_836039 [Suillus subalutaceus]|uniref:uncharacterized protein n=1 Tax=Suillus subalutaceus TaxID=48586 RepID=UPI001B868EA1|nr:uncharacterized protein DFJ58DRAFT_836039 [Suillus subalutaceus]KAG1875401.1 hypothetical protein DFJ58DRAFT_836039 [Suillus subalutaceus]